MTQRIPLTQGKVALVDDADYPDLAQHKWCAMRRNRVFYAVRGVPKDGGGQTLELMHRRILGAPKGVGVDHANCDGLDNRRENLRFATQQENMRNKRKRRDSASRFKGVFPAFQHKWVARICVDGHNRHLGTFATEEEAAIAYNRAALEHFGEFARLNRIHTHDATSTQAQGVGKGGNDAHTKREGRQAVRALPGHDGEHAAGVREYALGLRVRQGDQPDPVSGGSQNA